jgi:hypothetical protein
MKNKQAVTLLLLFILIGCLRGSRDEAVLAPLSSQLEAGFADEGDQPVYVVFADPLTAGVFRNLGRARGRYRVAPKDARLVCPSLDAKGMQGYQLRVSVSRITGDSAFATIQKICAVQQLPDTTRAKEARIPFSAMGQLVSLSENVLLMRVNGKWRFERVLSGNTSTML